MEREGSVDGSVSTAVVVPVYNEAAVLSDVVAALLAAFPLVICIDDGSTDGSADIARAAGARVLRHAVNLGQGAALQTGFDYVRRHTSAEHAVTFDSDGQHRVEDALAMAEVARSTGVDAVLGTRARTPAVGVPLSRRLLLSAAVRFSRWNSGLELSDTHNGLRVLSRRALESIHLKQSGMAHASELEAQIAMSGLGWIEHPVVIDYTEYSRSKGQSNLNAFNIVYELTVARLGTS